MPQVGTLIVFLRESGWGFFNGENMKNFSLIKDDMQLYVYGDADVSYMRRLKTGLVGRGIIEVV